VVADLNHHFSGSYHHVIWLTTAVPVSIFGHVGFQWHLGLCAKRKTAKNMTELMMSFTNL
jgi:hypothetical protein